LWLFLWIVGNEQIERENKREILIGKPVNLIPLDRTRGGGPDLPISHWGEVLNVDDPKFPGDTRNSRNHYTMSPMVTNSCIHESASP
jgi:hypothetical protein